MVAETGVQVARDGREKGNGDARVEVRCFSTGSVAQFGPRLAKYWSVHRANVLPLSHDGRPCILPAVLAKLRVATIGRNVAAAQVSLLALDTWRASLQNAKYVGSSAEHRRDVEGPEHPAQAAQSPWAGEMPDRNTPSLHRCLGRAPLSSLHPAGWSPESGRC